MEQRQIFLRDILSVVFKRKLLIAFFAIAVVVVVFLGNQVWPPTYESHSSVRILRGRETTQLQPTATQLSGGMTVVQMGREDINSEIQLITSNDVLATVVHTQGLEGSSGLRKIIFGALRAVGLKSSAAGTAQTLPIDGTVHDVSQEAVDDLRESVVVEAVPDSFVLDIAVRRGNAQEAQAICAALLDAYKQKHIGIFSTEDSKPFFDEQIVRIKSELKAAQDALNEQRTSGKIISVAAERELLQEQYSDAQKLLIQLAESERAAAAADDDGDGNLIAALSSQTESPVVTELQLKLLELVLRRNNLSRSLGPKHPEYLAVNEEIKAAQSRLADAIVSTRLTTQAKRDDIEARLIALSGAASEMERLESTAKVLTETLEYYQMKAEESLVADALAKKNISSIAISSPPQTPADPISPNKLLNLIIGVLAGLIGGVAIAFFLEYLDHGLKTPEDVEYFLRVPALASFFKGGKGLDARESSRLATLTQTLAPGGSADIIQVASAVPGEGSDSVARALADALADNPRGRTLLVDLTASSGAGFLDVVLGEARLEQVVSAQGNVALLPGGSRKDIPVHLWSSDRMAETLQGLRRDFSSIVFHTAPVLSANDAISLARMTDGAILVVKADATRREVAGRAVAAVTNAGGKVLGAVLTDRRQVIPSAIYKRI